ASGATGAPTPASRDLRRPNPVIPHGGAAAVPPAPRGLTPPPGPVRHALTPANAWPRPPAPAPPPVTAPAPVTAPPSAPPPAPPPDPRARAGDARPDPGQRLASSSRAGPRARDRAGARDRAAVRSGARPAGPRIPPRPGRSRPARAGRDRLPRPPAARRGRGR